MKITDGLLGEHALFYQLFDVLDEVIANASTANAIQTAFEPLAAGVLSHAAIENDILFAALGNGDGGITTAMRAEHREIEGLVGAVAKARTLEDARAAARQLLDLLRDHFEREEEILFPLCDHALDAPRLEALGARYKSERGLR